MKILVAEDDAAVAESVMATLRRAGFEGERAADGLEAEAALAAGGFDLLILDLGLPRKPGLEVLRGLRAAESRLPVLILTGLDAVSDRVRGLDAGADDYLAKPFDVMELLARVRALTRRGMSGGPVVARHGALTYDPVKRAASLNGQSLELSAREASVLEMFVQRVGQLVSKDQLLTHLCHWGEEVSPNAVEVYVHRLRKKLEPGGVRIVTVRGQGYSLEKPAA